MAKRFAALLALLLSTACSFGQSTANANSHLQRLKAELQNKPSETVDLLKKSELAALMKQQRYAEVEELAIAGTLALPGDTWRLQVLQSYRVQALLAEGKNEQALKAAKGLFNVCEMGYVKDALPLLSAALAASYPQDPGIVPRFKRQVLAGAQEDPAERQRQLARVGGNSVMKSIPADADPYRAALEARKSLTAWRDLYGTGNLLLLSGRIDRAREIFDQVYKSHPDGELPYASEALAKLIKAEEGGLGKANQFVRSIRPAP